MKNHIKKSDIQPWIQNIVWMARRYADSRRTYSPEMFNNAYKALLVYFTADELDKHPDSVVKAFPWAYDPGVKLKDE